MGLSVTAEEAAAQGTVNPADEADALFSVCRTRLVIQLVHGVTGVGDQFPEEDLPVSVDGIDHQVQQPFGFGLELFGSHEGHPSSS